NVTKRSTLCLPRPPILQSMLQGIVLAAANLKAKDGSMASQKRQRTTGYSGSSGKYSLALLTLSLVLIPKFMLAQTPGTLDPTFGTGGKLTTDFGTGAAARTVAVQADGQILTAGVAVANGATNFALARYNSDGTLDASLGTGGIVTTAFDFPGNFDRVFT